MGLLQLPTVLPSQVGIKPQRKRMVSTDNLATVTAAGYLNQFNLEGNPLAASDVLDVLYAYNVQTDAGTFGIFTVTITNGVITLVQWANPGDVLLPVVSGDFANFNGTTGQIKDAGFSPTDATKTKVVMLNSAPTSGHVAAFTSANGTIGDGGVLGTAAAKAASDNAQPTVASVSGSTTANALAVFADTAGTVKDASTATTLGQALSVTGGITAATGNISATVGNLVAGSSGNAGTVASFPATAANGELILAAVNAGGAFNTTVSNGTMGQSTVYTIPDIGAATGDIVVSTAAVRMKSVAGAAAAGGAAAQSFSDAFCTSGSNVIGNWNTQANAVSVLKIVPGNGSFVVTSSGDAGVGTFNYVIMK